MKLTEIISNSISSQMSYQENKKKLKIAAIFCMLQINYWWKFSDFHLFSNNICYMIFKSRHIPVEAYHTRRKTSACSEFSLDPKQCDHVDFTHTFLCNYRLCSELIMAKNYRRMMLILYVTFECGWLKIKFLFTSCQICNQHGGH
jgi:hypothetical protein